MCYSVVESEVQEGLNYDLLVEQIFIAKAERGAREAALLHWSGCVIVRWRGMCKRGG